MKYLNFLLYVLALTISIGVIFNTPQIDSAKFKHATNLFVNLETIGTSSKPFFESELVPQPKFLKSAHSAALAVIESENLIAEWFAGTKEGNPDVKVWQSIYTNGKWQLAYPVVDPELIRHSLGIYVRKVGNPVVYKAANGILHMFVVSVTIGGWSGSRLNHFISNDEGKSWHFFGRLILSPFFNLSTLVRTKPVTLSDGGFYLPVYNEFVRAYPELLRFDANGRFLAQIRINSKGYLLQPSLVPLTPKDAYVYLRNDTRTNTVLYRQTTTDGGYSWSEPLATNLVNQDSSIVVARIARDEFLMVHNVTTRDKLALSISKDGLNWQDVYYLENQGDHEFSYPAIEIHDGIIDILYTWERKKIKHVRFNYSWLGNVINEYNTKHRISDSNS